MKIVKIASLVLLLLLIVILFPLNPYLLINYYQSWNSIFDSEEVRIMKVVKVS